jgi:uncharacterized protein
MQSPFSWHDLMTTDVDAAKAFYGSVVGWNFTFQPPAYQVANAGGKGMGGIMGMPEGASGMPPFWAGYVYTPSVDEACKKVVALGGTIYREAWDIPGVIRMAVIADPTGATLNLMQPLTQNDGGLAVPGSVGTVGWNEHLSTDPEAAFDFYSGLFGWTKGTSMDMPGIGTYQVVQINGVDAVGMMKKPKAMPMSFWGYYFNVDAIDAATARLKEHGGSVMMGPHQVPGGNWIVTATDPQGAFFSLMSKTK